MRVKPKLSWFASEKGRKFVFAGTCFAGFSAFSVNFLPHTFLSEKFKDIVQMYRNGQGVPVPAQVLARAENVMDTMKLPPSERELVKFFTVYGFDPYFSGSTTTRTGAYIGIPSSFNYKKVTDVEKNMIIVRGEPVSWDSKSGKDLLNSLVLSEQAQKFAIATQIHQARTYHIYLHSTTAALCVLATYTFTHSTNKKVNAFARPVSFRIILYTLIGSFMGGVWALMKDLTTASLENNADREVAESSIELAQGGLEFYEQVLRRNTALRELMGPSGEKLFAASGNSQILFRTKHLPITQRRDNLKTYLSSKLEKKDPTTVPS